MQALLGFPEGQGLPQTFPHLHSNKGPSKQELSYTRCKAPAAPNGISKDVLALGPLHGELHECTWEPSCVSVSTRPVPLFFLLLGFQGPRIWFNTLAEVSACPILASLSLIWISPSRRFCSRAWLCMSRRSQRAGACTGATLLKRQGRHRRHSCK